MGLFNFSQKKSLPEIKDIVWLNKTAKFNGCKNLIQQHQNVVVVAWFSDTQEEFSNYLNEQQISNVEIKLARFVTSIQDSGKPLILLEHYPLRNKEEDFIISLNPSLVYVLNSLDEALFKYFGGDRIAELIKNLNMKEDEELNHPMISRAIEQAQRKLEKNLVVESSADSQKVWLERNAAKLNI